jgi:hypothetical protein
MARYPRNGYITFQFFYFDFVEFCMKVIIRSFPDSLK